MTSQYEHARIDVARVLLGEAIEKVTETIELLNKSETASKSEVEDLQHLLTRLNFLIHPQLQSAIINLDIRNSSES